MSVIKSRRSETTVKYLEDASLTILTKKDVKERRPRPPKVRGKHFSNLDYLAEADLVWLTPDKSRSFPILIYDKSRDSSYFEQCFWPLRKLGEGSFGSVLMVLGRCDMMFYAMKVSKEPYRNNTDRALKLKEVFNHQQFSKHPNIVTLHEAWEEDRYFYLQMELCQRNLVVSEPVPESQCWEILADMSSALDFIHDLGVAHFDVKLENIQLGYDGLYKLSDFGLVYNFKEDKKRLPQDGDAKYLAPELLSLGFPLQKDEVSSKADIFSLGIAVMELAGNLSLPSNGRVWKALRENTFPFAQTAHITDDLFFLLTKMMSPDPSRRPSAKEILNIPIVKAVLKKRKALSESVGQPMALWTSELLLYMAIWALFGAFLFLMAKLSRQKQIPCIVVSQGEVSPSISDLIKQEHPEKRVSFGEFNSFSSVNNNKDEEMLICSTPLEHRYRDSHPICDNETGHTENRSSSSLSCEDLELSQMTNSHSCSFSNSTHYSSSALQGFKVPESYTRSPLAPLPGSSMNTMDRDVCFSAPSILRFGFSPIHISNEVKEVVKAKKRKRLMTPRNLSQSFDEDFDG